MDGFESSRGRRFAQMRDAREVAACTRTAPRRARRAPPWAFWAAVALAAAGLCAPASVAATEPRAAGLVLASDFDGAMVAPGSALRLRARIDGFAVRADHVLRRRWVIGASGGSLDSVNAVAATWLAIGVRGGADDLGLCYGVALQAGTLGGKVNASDRRPPAPGDLLGLTTDVPGLRLVAGGRWVGTRLQLGVDIGVRAPNPGGTAVGLGGSLDATWAQPLGPLVLLLRGAAFWSTLAGADAGAPPLGGALGAGVRVGGLGLLLEARAGILEPSVAARGVRGVLSLVWQR